MREKTPRPHRTRTSSADAAARASSDRTETGSAAAGAAPETAGPATGGKADSAAGAPEGPAFRPRPCPICGALAVKAYRPFCSRRCADVDLHRWLAGSYAIPGSVAPAADDES